MSKKSKQSKFVCDQKRFNGSTDFPSGKLELFEGKTPSVSPYSHLCKANKKTTAFRRRLVNFLGSHFAEIKRGVTPIKVLNN